MLHIYPMCVIINFPGIDTGKRDWQINKSSEQHPAGILLMKISGKVWLVQPGIGPGSIITALHVPLLCYHWAEVVTMGLILTTIIAV